MNSTPQKLSEVIQVEKAAEALSYTMTIEEDWAQGRATFGGILASAAANAARAEQEDGFALRSALTSFVAPARPGRLEIALNKLRQGKNTIQWQVELSQDEQTIASLILCFGRGREGQFEIEGPRAPDAKKPEELDPLPYMEGITPRFTQHFDYRYTGNTLPFGGHKEGKIQGWVKARDTAAVTESTILSLLDAWPPPIWIHADSPIPGSTITWQVNFMDEVHQDGFSGEQYFYYEAETTAAAGGFSDFQGNLWSPDGKLLAVSRQLFVGYKPLA